jgi:hypothetical protein
MVNPPMWNNSGYMQVLSHEIGDPTGPHVSALS